MLIPEFIFTLHKIIIITIMYNNKIRTIVIIITRVLY